MMLLTAQGYIKDFTVNNDISVEDYRDAVETSCLMATLI